MLQITTSMYCCCIENDNIKKSVGKVLKRETSATKIERGYMTNDHRQGRILQRELSVVKGHGHLTTSTSTTCRSSLLYVINNVFKSLPYPFFLVVHAQASTLSTE